MSALDEPRCAVAHFCLFDCQRCHDEQLYATRIKSAQAADEFDARLIYICRHRPRLDVSDAPLAFTLRYAYESAAMPPVSECLRDSAHGEPQNCWYVIRLYISFTALALKLFTMQQGMILPIDDVSTSQSLQAMPCYRRETGERWPCFPLFLNSLLR